MEGDIWLDSWLATPSFEIVLLVTFSGLVWPFKKVKWLVPNLVSMDFVNLSYS